jgi:CNT family concentrative nucleoside transporter
MTLPPSLRRLGRVWMMFAACGLFGALSTVAFTAGAPADKPAVAAPQDASAALAARAAEAPPTTVLDRSMSAFGLFALVGLCWLISTDRKRVNWRLVAWGMALQIIFGVLILKTGPGLWFFQRLNDGTMALLGFTNEGTKFLFGSFVTGSIEAPMINFAFNVLPTIIFISALMTVGYHLGLMQAVVNVFAVIMHKTMKCSGAETLSTAANIFVGQTEAPLVVKPYIEDMTKSELLAIMVGGFANTAGGVLAAYVGMLHAYFPDIAGHLIAQSVMSAPAALVCAKVAMPETETPKTMGHVKMGGEKLDANVIDAAARGASEGLTLAFNVAAMLLAFIALIAMLNATLKAVGGAAGFPSVSLENALALAGYPIAFLMGVPLQDCWTVGKLIGVKTVLNEFVAYLQLADILKTGQPLSHRSIVIASYALSGFANFSSIAIQIGGISGIAPSRRHDLAKLGLKAMFVGAIATFMTANIAGILVP